VKAAVTDLPLHESSYQKTDVAFREKAVLAPLARMESLADNDDELEQVMSVTVICDVNTWTLFLHVSLRCQLTKHSLNLY